jgi:AraC-like DNA-binding protein
MSPPKETAWRAFVARNIGVSGVLMFGRYQLAASRSGLLPHSHRNAIEICFLERGEQTYRVGGFLHRLRGNDQFFTLPGEVHDTANLPQERGILYWLILRLEPSKKFLGLSERIASLLKRELCRMPTRHFRAHPESARILGEINELLQEGPKLRGRFLPLRELRLQALLLQYLTRTIEASHQGIHGSASPLMQRILHYIDDHLNEPVQVSRLAQVAHLSESRCKARFKREIGVPPAEFWLRKKIERAIVLLKNRSVTEVAYELGFSSSQYFATVFKRYTLVNPSQFHAVKTMRAGRANRY